MGFIEILLAFLTSFVATLAWAARGLVIWPLRFARRQVSRAIVWFIGPELRRHRGADSRVSIRSDGVSWRNQPSVMAGIHPVPQCPEHLIDLLVRSVLDGQIHQLDDGLQISEKPSRNAALLFCSFGGEEGHTLQFTQSTTVREAKARARELLRAELRKLR